MKRLLLLLSVFFTFFSVSVYAEEIPSSPPSNGVYDPQVMVFMTHITI